MKLPLINERIFESYKNPIEKGDSLIYSVDR